MYPRVLTLLVAGTLLLGSASVASAGHHHRRGCCDPCTPPPVQQTLCVKDPCSCCSYEVDVCVPACCADEAPCVSWRSGIFGRRVATYTWPCCGHSVDVVVTKHGKVRVRG